MSDDRHHQSRPRNRGVYPCGLARWHSPPGLIPATVTSSSTFLRSLRSRPVTALLRYYGRSDSCPPESGTRGVPHACSPCGQVSLIHAPGLPTIPSPTTSGSPDRLRTPPRIGPDRLKSFPWPGFAHYPQARRTRRPNRVQFPYGLVVHLLLLPTPSRDDAVAVGYR